MRNGASAAPAGSAGSCGATTSLLYGPAWCVPYSAAYSRRMRSLCGRGRDGGAGGLRMWAVLTCVSLDFCLLKTLVRWKTRARCVRRHGIAAWRAVEDASRGEGTREAYSLTVRMTRDVAASYGSIAGTASRRPARISRWLASRSAGVQGKVLGWLTRDHRYCGGRCGLVAHGRTSTCSKSSTR
ncbi:hypothetical protein DFH06DRAFT_1202932 [Mycena polygramma]|nr:hypothetical protein DFH06DRAFT_1202932 [Mycena polygramma]